MVDEKKIELDALVRNISNMKEEEDMYTGNLAKMKQMIHHTEERLRLQKVRFPFILEGLIPLKPSFEFEKDPRIIALNKELETINNESQITKFEEEIVQLGKSVVKTGEELARIKAHIPVLEKQLVDLEGD